MAGHSQFANIKHRKGAQDKKRANLFTKLAREIIVSAKIGMPDPAFNPRLRAAISAAKAASMPKDRIENCIKRAINPADGENYEEIRYEAYAPGGVALIIDALTDNRNRSASDIRTILTKAGGNLGETGSVAFMFDKVGIIQYKAGEIKDDQMLEAAIEAGADNCESNEDYHEITCNPSNFNEIRDALNKKFGEPQTARLGWKPKTNIEVEGEIAEKVIKLIDILEDHDDVQYVTANAAIKS